MVEAELVVEVELMNERRECWHVVGSGATVDAAVAAIEQLANTDMHEENSVSWVMSEWRAL